MKLIIVGGTGFVATELIRQSLAMPEITSVVAVARRAVELEENAVNKAKFKSVLIKDYEEYPDKLKGEFAGANACIWTVAITPFKIGKLGFAEIKRVCQTCAVAGLKAICEANPVSAKPTKFVYMSAEGTPQDLTKKPFMMGDYQIMRGETEKIIHELGVEHREVDVHIVRPGMVWAPTTFWRTAHANAFRATNIFTRAIPNISRTELSAAILDQLVHGFEKEDLSNADLVRIGGAALKRISKA